MASKETEVLDPAATIEKLKKIVSRRALSRRKFMTAVGVAGAASGAALVSSRSTSRPSIVEAGGYTQTDFLNFILNIEYLQATFFSYITQATDLPPALTAGSGLVTGWPGQINTKGAFTGTPVKVVFANQQITDLMNEIYYDQLNHVIGLRSILGANAITRPTLNLVSVGAPSTSITYTFALTGAQALGITRLLADVAITAYTTMNPLLSASNLTYASQVLATEGFHSGALRLLNIQQATPYDPKADLVFTGVLTSGSTAVTGVSSIVGLSVGTPVAGVGIAANTTIATLGPTSSPGTGTLTLSIAATASTSSGALTIIATNIPGDALDVQPVDPGTAALSAAGPSAIAGTSNPTVDKGFFATSGANNATAAAPVGTAFVRTTSQICAILFGTVGAPAAVATTAAIVAGVPAVVGTAKGGFYPGTTATNGFNGNINGV